MNFLELLDKIKSIHTKEEATSLLLSFNDSKRVKEAIEFAIIAHKGQKRKSGEEYVIHPILVATITAYFNNDEDVIIAAILHDVVEDTSYTLEDIEKRFGSCVSHLVSGLTKIDNIRESSLIPSTSNEKLAKSALTFRKMLISSIQDVRVLVIKLCDRLHNMLTLDALPEKKQKRIAEETLVVYTPIAHRLGIAKLKNILEDLAFKYLLPNEYKKIDEYIKSHKNEFISKLNHFIQKVEKLLLQNNIKDFEINYRIKHYYSIFLKMQRKGISIEEVLDLLATRIIVNENLECYKTLGVIHLNFRPLISRFKDYIAIPKDNGYQTLHTTVYDGTSIIEVQIRTKDMHKNAEFGIAAHWKYKLNTSMPNLKWLEEMKYDENVEDFYELAKNDLFSEDIIVYSPKFDTFTLPRDATALDFAYAIHTDIGNRAVEAYINKEKATLLTTLKTGDIVKIITQDEIIPRCSWIDNLKTAKAKYEQKKLCRQKEKEINKKLAIGIIKQIFDINEIKARALIKANKLCNTIENIVNDESYLKEVITTIYNYLKKKNILYFKNIKLKEFDFGNIKVLSNKNVNSTIFSYCCHPKFGDKILGIVENRDIEIHHRFCNNAEKKIDKALFVDWIKDKQDEFILVVSLPNKKGELSKFIHLLTKLNIFINSIQLGKDSFNCSLEIEFDKKRFNIIKSKIEREYKIIEFISKKDAYNG